MIYAINPKLPEGCWKLNGRNQKRVLSEERLRDIIERKAGAVQISPDLHGHFRELLAKISGFKNGTEERDAWVREVQERRREERRPGKLRTGEAPAPPAGRAS